MMLLAKGMLLDMMLLAKGMLLRVIRASLAAAHAIASEALLKHSISASVAVSLSGAVRPRAFVARQYCSTKIS